MSCNRCANQATAAMTAAGVPANQTQAAWASNGQQPKRRPVPGRCDRCGAFLTRQGQCKSPRCARSTQAQALSAGASQTPTADLPRAVIRQLEAVGVPDQQVRAIAASRERPGARGKKLRKLIRDRLERLAQLTDEAAAGKEMKRWFKFVSQFHKYSFCNRYLVLMQRRDATRVAGYKAWQRVGRQVRRDEKGIAIFVPRTWRRQVQDASSGETREERGKYFRIGHVYDVSQTDGEPLPEPPQWINRGDEGVELAQALTRYAEGLDIEVTEAQLPGQRQGESHRGRVVLRQDATPLGKAATLAHEVAHELMHGPEHRTPGRRRTNELEAEACAYVVCQHFGYETQAPNYLALWRGNREALMACMERITAASQQIIDALEEQAASSD